MSWKVRKIGDYCEITSSKRIFCSEYSETGVPFYRSKEIIERSQGQAISEPLFITNDRYNQIKEKFGVPVAGDMLLTSVGTIGIPYIVKNSDYFYFKDGNLTWFRNFNGELNSKYLYYWIKSNDGQKILYNTTIGSSQKALTISALKNIEIPLPPVNIQCRIADILSAYDDLIENNRKQIKLLEEAAQRLYKEWFVDLRFPGHEHTKIVDGVPEGWEKKPIDDVFIIKYGKTLPTSKIAKTGTYPVYGANGVIGFYKEKNCDEYATLITSRGNGSGDVLRTYHKEAFVTNNSFIVSPMEKYAYCKVQYIYYLMKSLLRY